MMYNIDHHLVDVEPEKFLRSGDCRTRGGHKYYQQITTSEAYRNSFFPRTVITDSNQDNSPINGFKDSYLGRLLCQFTCCSLAAPSTFRQDPGSYTEEEEEGTKKSFGHRNFSSPAAGIEPMTSLQKNETVICTKGELFVF